MSNNEQLELFPDSETPKDPKPPVGTRKPPVSMLGKSCVDCGCAHWRNNGTCFVCMNCGTTTGCS